MMPVISVQLPELERLLGSPPPRETLLAQLPLMGCDIDHVEGDELAVEFFPNRPDCYSVEGIARALRCYLGLGTPTVHFAVSAPTVSLKVHPSVVPLRPHIVCGIARNLHLDDPTITSLIGLQEKLDLTLGRQRAKVSIGLHDLRSLSPPFEYKAVGRDFSFAPLSALGPEGPTHEQEIATILREHPKGVAYAHLLPKRGPVPIILDSQRRVLSMPPIINGTHSAVTARTTDLFLDITGTDGTAVAAALNVMMTMLLERGGVLEAVTIVRPDGSLVAPDLRPRAAVVAVDQACALLGVPLDAAQVAQCLARMGHEAKPAANGRTVQVATPAYRVDFLHAVDWLEEVAIGYGFDRFGGSLPTAQTFGRPLPLRLVDSRARIGALGMGFTEMVGFTLSNDLEQYGTSGLPPPNPTRISNPTSDEQTLLRTSLLPGLLGQLRLNRQNDLPQRIFEVGDVVIDHRNVRALGLVWIASKVGWSDIKGVGQRLLQDLGVDAQMIARERAGFIVGRVGILLTADHREVGVLGEIHPAMLEAFGLAAPTVALELRLEGTVEPEGVGALPSAA